MNENRLMVSASPHINASVSVRKIMGGVCVALLPTLVVSAIVFGPWVLLLTGVTVASCVAFEMLYAVLMKKPQSIGDLSAVVTGMLLAFNLPAGFPLWMACVGSFIAIVIVKQLFGGIGFNFANPALVARIVLQISFLAYMTDFVFPKNVGTLDALAGATPLAAAESGYSLVDLLLGTHGGVLGETCALTLIIGGLFLVVTRIISPAIPAVYIGGTFLLKFLLELLAYGNSFAGAGVASLAYVLSGGLLLGAFFMATDYTTSPYSLKGKLVFACGLAVITVALREWSNMTEGVSYALLIMNLLVPYINSGLRQTPLGVKKKRAAKAGKGAA